MIRGDDAVTPEYDLVLLGSAGRNSLHRPDGTVEAITGGPLFHCAFATTCSNRRVAVVTRMSPQDYDLLEPLEREHISVYVVPTPQTMRSHIIYESNNPDDRHHILEMSAGSFSLQDIPPIRAGFMHLAGVNRVEFPIAFMLDLYAGGQLFSVDMQALVRRAEPSTGTVVYEDYPYKMKVAAIADKIKLDVVEAEILTGTPDPEKAAIQFEHWGASDVMVTSPKGALVRFCGTTYFEPFNNRNNLGRTGRGDTVFTSYLLCRMDLGVPESLKFATALASIKMESPGFFGGSLEDVLRRINGQD